LYADEIADIVVATQPAVCHRNLRGAATSFAFRSVWWFSALWALLFPWARPGSARVVVLVERGASLYVQAARGFDQAFGNTDDVDLIEVDPASGKIEKPLEGDGGEAPRLIIAVGTHAAIAAKNKFPATPVLYCLALNPEQNKLVGPDIGGVTLNVTPAQQFSELQRLLPAVRRIGVIYDAQTSGQIVSEAQKHLRGGMQLVARAVGNPKEAARFAREMVGEVDAFWLLWDPVIANAANFRLLVELTLKNRVALIAPAAPFVEAGALVSVAADYHKAGEQAGRIAKLVLQGRKAGEFRAEPPFATVLTINGPVARKLGIAIPDNLTADILNSASLR
jgi:putative ABC transport system substrate-binding protein